MGDTDLPVPAAGLLHIRPAVSLKDGGGGGGGGLWQTAVCYGRKHAKAARLVGINTFSILFKAYLFGGFCNAVGAIILTGKLGVANPTMGNDLFLDIMSAAVIGGCSLFGGKGSVVGTAFGVLLLGLISNGLSLLGVEYQATTVVKGGVILAAIVLDTIQSQISARKMLMDTTDKTEKEGVATA